MRMLSLVPLLPVALATGFAASGLAAGSASTFGTALTGQAYFTALGPQGEPAADLRAADLIVKEDGRVREIISVAPATTPMHVAVLVDDNGSGIFRYGLTQFVQRMYAHAEISLTVVIGQPLTIVKFTSDLARLGDGLQRLGIRPETPDGGQLLAAIYEAALDLRHRHAERGAIVAVTVGGAEQSSLSASDVLQELQQSGASLHVVSVASSAMRAAAALTKPADMLDGVLSLAEVLGDGPRQSGGMREEIVATTGSVTQLQSLSEQLTHQYVVRYDRAPRAQGRVSITTTRRDVSLRVPSRIPKN